MEKSIFPFNWTCATLSDVSIVQAGAGFPTSKQGRTSGEIPFYKVGDISKNWQNGNTCLKAAANYISRSEVSELGAKILPQGAVVFAKIGAAIALNRRGITSQDSVVDNNVMGLIPTEAIYPQYLLQFMCQIDLGSCSRGGNVPSIRKGDVEDIPFPLPPLNEQKRIVAKIEELFSELDAGVENLKKAKEQLGIYRQSLLKQAFEGKLTEQWRKDHADELESAETLLANIRAEREARYQQQLQDWQTAVSIWESNGKQGKKPTKPTKPKPVEQSLPTESTRISHIPVDWLWLDLQSIGVIGSGMSVSKNRKFENPIEVPYLRVANVQRGSINLDTVKTMKIENEKLESFSLKSGDILFNEGGDRDKLGRGWVWKGQLDPCITQNHVFRLSLDSSKHFVPEFISHWGNAFGQDFFFEGGKQTTNLASINRTTLSRLPVPVPSFREQVELLRILDEQFAAIEENEKEIEAALQRAEALRQSILKKAFSGELVPQDPNDEPASVLLERIRSEREAAALTKKPSPRRKKSASSK